MAIGAVTQRLAIDPAHWQRSYLIANRLQKGLLLHDRALGICPPSKMLSSMLIWSDCPQLAIHAGSGACMFPVGNVGIAWAIVSASVVFLSCEVLRLALVEDSADSCSSFCL
jgi:hypothetical protein